MNAIFALIIIYTSEIPLGQKKSLICTCSYAIIKLKTFLKLKKRQSVYASVGYQINRRHNCANIALYKTNDAIRNSNRL